MDGRIAGIARLLVVCGVAVATAYARHDEPVIKTDGGFVQGTHSVDYPTVGFFLGIPYAAPPVDTLRWKPPQPPAPDPTELIRLSIKSSRIFLVLETAYEHCYENATEFKVIMVLLKRRITSYLWEALNRVSFRESN